MPIREMDRYSLVILRRPPNAPQMSEAELDALQEKHLAFLQAMRARGVMLAAGPFADQPHESWRGLCLYTTSLDETRALAAEDPAVLAGRLSVEVLTWLTPKGTLKRETTPG
jgi:uncharacterized protein YciI